MISSPLHLVESGEKRPIDPNLFSVLLLQMSRSRVSMGLDMGSSIMHKVYATKVTDS
jgi:hypothetical protein